MKSCVDFMTLKDIKKYKSILVAYKNGVQFVVLQHLGKNKQRSGSNYSDLTHNSFVDPNGMERELIQ